MDHTCYTVYTAGTSGFLQILPIYLDHILFPTLRKEDFATEVHHISGRGRYMLLRVVGEPVKCFFANGMGDLPKKSCQFGGYQLPLQTIHKDDTGKVSLTRGKMVFLPQKERYICIPNFCKEGVADF